MVALGFMDDDDGIVLPASTSWKELRHPAAQRYAGSSAIRAGRLQQASALAGTNGLQDVFQDLESKENILREKLGQPAVLPFTPREAAGEKNVREADDVKKPVPPKRDELPVG